MRKINEWIVAIKSSSINWSPQINRDLLITSERHTILYLQENNLWGGVLLLLKLEFSIWPRRIPSIWSSLGSVIWHHIGACFPTTWGKRQQEAASQPNFMRRHTEFRQICAVFDMPTGGNWFFLFTCQIWSKRFRCVTTSETSEFQITTCKKCFYRSIVVGFVPKIYHIQYLFSQILNVGSNTHF